MIFLNVSFGSGTSQRPISSVDELRGVLRQAGFGAITREERKGLLSLIHDDQIRKTYGIFQGRELMRDIRSRAQSLPRAFDDLALLKPRTRLGETGVTVERLQEVEYRIRNTNRRNMKRWLQSGASPVLNRELALFGFCRLSAHVLATYGKKTLFVCVGRSPTPIAAYLQGRTPNVCILPFSGARLNDLSGETIAESRRQTRAHFDAMLGPHMGGCSRIVLVDYSTSGQSILTTFNMVHDYLSHTGRTTNLSCLSIWHSKRTLRSLNDSDGHKKRLAATRSRVEAGSWLKHLPSFVKPDSFIRHLCLREAIEAQFDEFYTYTTRWSVEMRRDMFDAMMDMLDNQSFDFLSPYRKSPILKGALPSTFMSPEGIQRFRELGEEMRSIEQAHNELVHTVLSLQVSPL